MTLQWTLVASFLYAEIAFIILLLLPFIPPRFWESFLRSRFFLAFANRANLYVTVFIAVLVMFFIDSIREMNKYSHGISSAEHKHLDTDLQLSLKLFRSQRNYYISGLALFLFVVIRRLIILILAQATLQKEIEKTMREAQDATDRAEKLMKEQNERHLKEASQNNENLRKESLQQELNALTYQLSTVKEELRGVKSDLVAVKTHSSAVEEEYDKLLQEHTALQERYKSLHEN